MEHVDLKGMRPLDRAISSENVEVIKCFLRKGAKLGPSTWNSASGKPNIMYVIIHFDLKINLSYIFQADTFEQTFFY